MFILTIITIFAIISFISCTGSPAGDVVQIEKPVLIAPENNASELLAPITLDWTGALDSYTLMYSDDYSALQNSTGKVEQTNSSQMVVNVSDGTWFWKVKGKKNGIETGYTDIRSFSVGFDSPPVIEEDAEATVTASLSETDEIILTWPEYKSENYQGEYVYYEYFIYEDDSEMGMRSSRLIDNATCSTNNATFTPPGNTNRFRSTVLAKNGSNMQAIVGNNTFSKDKVADNRPPVNPYGPRPSKRENGVDLNPTLGWKCYDPDGNALEYDVYFGEAVNAMELVAEQITEQAYTPGQLESGQEYFWRIIVRESDTDKQKEKKSPIWSFETMGTDSFKISVQSTPSIAGDVRIGTGKWGYKDSAVVGQNEQVTLEYREDKDYTFAGWYDQGQLIGENNEIDILVNEDKEIFAKFIEEGQIPPKIQKVSESPTGTIQATSVTFEWTEGDTEESNGNRVITEYFIRKDSDDWEKNTPALSTTYTWNDYDEDKHTFEVKAKDEKGLDSNILKWEFTHEASNTAPTIEKLSFQDGVIHTASTTFIWSAEDEDGEIDHYAYSKERGDWQVTHDTSYTWDDYSTGTHVFSVKAIDEDENESDVIRWDFTYTIEPAIYTVTVESNPVGGGFIRVHSGEWVTEKTVIDEENTELTIEASPNSDYIFEGWQSDNTAISDANPYTFLIDTDQTLKAVFTEIPNASPTVQKVDGPGEEINENTATFEWSGTDGAGERAISKYQYKKNEDAWVDMNPLTATTYTWNEIAEGDHTFSVRAVDDEGSQSNVVTWSFTYNKPEFTLTIDASPTEGGTVSNNGSYHEGTEVTIQATSNTGYQFVNWMKDGEEISTSADYTYEMPAENVTLVANFKFHEPPVEPSISTMFNPGPKPGNLLPETFDIVVRSTHPDSELVYLKAELFFEGSVEDFWSEEATSTGSSQLEVEKENLSVDLGEAEQKNILLHILVRDIDGNTYSKEEIYTVYKTVNEYTLTIEASPTEGGEVSFDNTTWTNIATKSVEEGTDVDIYARAADGYTFEGWYENEILKSTDNLYTVTVTTDRIIEASFIKTDGTKKWEFVTGKYINGNPAIGSDGTIYVGSGDNKLYAINPDGTKKWEFVTNNWVYSSPAIGSDGTIYVGSHDHKLYAINPDGTKKWGFLTNNGIFSSPSIGSDGTIYVGSSDHKLYAINPDGTKKWEFSTEDLIQSSPVIGADGTIYVGSYDHKLYAINSDGTKKWEFVTGNPIFSTPAIGSDGTIYVGSHDHKLYAINPDGTKKWEFVTGNPIFSSPSVGSDGTIYVGSLDNKLYAINVDGTKKWEFLSGNLVVSTPLIGADGTVYVGSYDTKLYAINSDGTKKWEFVTGERVYSSPTIGADGTIYVGSDDYKLYAINNNGEGLMESVWPKFKQNIKNTGRDKTATQLRSLTLEASPTEGGDVSFDNTTWSGNASKTVEEGTEVDIYAKTTDEYTFEGWYEDGVEASNQNPYTVIVESDKILKAYFEEIPNTVPNIEKVDGPDDGEQIVVNSASFEWSGSDESDSRAITKYQFQKDSDPWEDMTPLKATTYTWENISEGDHTFSVRVVDDDGAYSESINWSFVYKTQILILDYLSGEVQVKGQGLKDIKRIMFEMNYDSEKVNMGSISAEIEGVEEEISFYDTKEGTFTIDIDLPSIKDTIDGTIACIIVVSASGSSSITISDATVINVVGENELENTQIQTIGDSIHIEGNNRLVLLHGGKFIMGDTIPDEVEPENEKPTHEVELTYNYYIGKYEVTFNEYDAYCRATGEEFPNDLGWGRSSKPVININWYEAIHYCNWLSIESGYSIAYDGAGNLLDKNGNITTDITSVEGYRLPTEAEWEYAARGAEKDQGTPNDFLYAGSNNLDEVGWYIGNCKINNNVGPTHTVGEKKSNEVGIYDMSGNVWEFCHDFYDSDFFDYSSGLNPVCTTYSTYRSERGGSRSYSEESCRVSNRNRVDALSVRTSNLGFRVARTSK